MDPYLQAVTPWTGPEPSEVKAYNMARSKGYTFPNVDKIGRLSQSELDHIATYSPNVSFRSYMKIRDMTKEELLQLYPSLASLTMDPSYEDLFYYATRGWSPTYPYLGPSIKRYDHYNRLSLPIQRLLDKMYGGQVEFAKAVKNHPLEGVAMTFEQTMDRDSLTRKLAQNAGIHIREDENASDAMLARLNDAVDQNK
jgi:hypothetical protein